MNFRLVPTRMERLRWYLRSPVFRVWLAIICAYGVLIVLALAWSSP